MKTIKKSNLIRPLPSENVMLRALMERDSQFEGVFFVAVRTTGIFCRPTCTARKPRPENVEFFGSPAAALHAGYRPCKLCQPTEDNRTPPAWVSELLAWIEQSRADSRIRDHDLRSKSIDPARARRYFQKHYGMTFQAFQRARRLAAAMRDIRAGVPLSYSPYRNGYESDSGFRDAFTKLFGNPPSRTEQINCLMAHWTKSPLGPLLIIASDDGVCMLEFVDRRALSTELELVRKRFGAVIVPGINKHIEQLAAELEQYFACDLRNFSTPLDSRGTAFQEIVWRALREIPYGETESYVAMANAIGRAGSQRAVGRANGQNRIAIVTPCHRVVRENGELCGYGGGLWRKKWLLDHEQANRSSPQDRR